MPCHKAPSGSAWVHEIKHDGYRLIARSHSLEKRKAKLEKILAMARASFNMPARWDWRASFRSDGIFRIEAVVQKAG
jgi:hypothetical protein